MDLLGSILGGMDALPKKHVDEETKRKVKEAKEKAEKFKEQEIQRKADFRIKIESKINVFLQGPSEERKLVFDPMNQVERSIVHDVAETAGLSAYSFGEEDVDRYIIVWKKEYTPCEAELEALYNGEEYDPTAADKTDSEIALQNTSEENNDKGSGSRKRRTKNTENEPEKYFEKYAKIVGSNSGLNAAKVTQSNKAYGMVPSKNKQDKRSIEETMKELREKRKGKSTATD